MEDKDKIFKPEMLVKIGKLHSSGNSIGAICKRLREEDGINAGFTAVKRAITVYSTRSGEIIQGDKELKSEIKGIILDTKSQLQAVNTLVWDLIKEAKNQGKLNLQTAIPAIKELREQLKLNEDILKRMNENVDYKQMGKVEMTQIIIEKLEVLEKQGYIKVINQPGSLVALDTNKEKESEVIENGSTDDQNESN